MNTLSILSRNRTIHTSEDTQVAGLPEDIVILILLRLPIKSLLKSRCVSKSWCSLISSSQFIEMHLQISESNTNFTNHNIIILDIHRPSALAPILNQSLLVNPTYAFEQSFPYIGSTCIVAILGCCNGLCCVLLEGVSEREFLLWNPSTRKSLTVPIGFPLVPADHEGFLGFGFEESKGDYKVFEGFVTKDGGLCIAYLYSFKYNYWRRVKHPYPYKGGVPFGISGVFVNGNFHWLMKNDIDNGLDIVSFDIGIEMYGGVVKEPTILDRRLFPTMGVLGGCLSLVSVNQEIYKDIWVLKKYGFAESWEKVMIIPYCLNLTRMLVGIYILCITPAGEIVFAGGQSIFIYDPKSDVFPRKIDSPYFAQLDGFSQINVCTQSLVSLPSNVGSLVSSPHIGDHQIQQSRLTKQHHRGSNIVCFLVLASFIVQVVHVGRRPQLLNVLKQSICLLKKKI